MADTPQASESPLRLSSDRSDAEHANGHSQTIDSTSPSSEKPEPNSNGAAKTVGPTAPVIGEKSDGPGLSDEDRGRAARTLQRRWRARKAHTGSNARWQEMNIQMRYAVNRAAAEDAKNDPTTRWRRAGFMAARLQEGNAIPGNNTPPGDDDISEQLAAKGKIKTKTLETQHWLELIDGKHRYGSNLKFYFRRWAEADTEENFFYWLDRGGGKDLDLEECPREQLESERITYLSAEQRLNYLVKIDDRGRLRWARNGVLVDTRANRWKDSEGGQGVVPLDGTEDRAVEHRLKRQVTTLSGGPSTSSSSSSSLDAMAQAEHYSGNPQHGKIKRAFASRLTSKGITDRLLKKTVKKNTWIYAADAKFNLFVGMKHTGTFQHSSLTGGGLITSAGLIKVKDGQITSLSPLSGHYRTSIDHFKVFLEVMESRGADLHKVQRTKAEVALWGLSRWKTFKKAQSAFVKDRKDEVKNVVHRSSTSSSSKPTPPREDDKPKPSNGNKPADSTDPKRNTSSESSSSPAESDDHSWLPENWRQAALAGRRKAMSKLTPATKKTDDEHSTSPQDQGSTAAVLSPDSETANILDLNDEGIVKEMAKPDTSAAGEEGPDREGR